METNLATEVAVEDRFVRTMGGRLFVRAHRPEVATSERRDRSPIVLFHDSLGCVELWRGFPTALARRTGRTVFAYDRLGFGRSDARTERPSRDFVAEEARTALPSLRAELGIERFVVFGHSVGGGMAIHVAVAFHEACIAAITESAQAFVEDRTLAGIREAKAGFRNEEQLARLARYHGDKAKWVLDAWTETWLSDEFATWSLDAALPGVRCPLLAIHGAEDEYGSPRHPERIAALAGGPARAVILDAIHHVPHREVEPTVLDLVAGFLAPIA